LHDALQVPKVALRDVDQVVQDDMLQGAETLKFRIKADDQRAPFLAPDLYVRIEDRMYRITEMVQERTSGQAFIQVNCEARWTELSRRVKVGSTSILAKTNAQGLTTILTGTGWTSGGTPTDATLYSIDELDETVVFLLRRWADVTGTEIEFDTINKTVTLVEATGESLGVGFRYGHNVRSITRRYEPPVATRLYAYGANGLTIAGPNPTTLEYVENYDWYIEQGLTLLEAQARYRKDQVWSDERYLVAVNLYDAALRRIATLARPIIAYEMDVLDFSALTGAVAPVNVGDSVLVRDEEFNVDLSTRVVRRVRHPAAPWRDQVELEYLQQTLNDSELEVGGRTVDPGAFSLLVDATDAPVTVNSGTTVWAEIAITVAGETSFAAGGTFRGVATGTGTVTFQMTIDGTVVGQAFTVPFDAAVNGGQVEFSWPTFATGITEGSYLVDWRAQVTTGSGTIAVAAEAARAWIMIQGAVGVGVNTSPSQALVETVEPIVLLDLTAALEDWTAVTSTPGIEDVATTAYVETVSTVSASAVTAVAEEWTVALTSILQFVDFTPETWGGADSVSVVTTSIPVSAVENDLIVAVVYQESGSANVTGPAGFTQIAQASNVGVDLWAEVWTATDDGTMGGDSIDFNLSSAARAGVFVFVLRDSNGVGVAAEATSTTNYNGGAGVEPFASVTSGGLGRIAVAISCCNEIAVGTTTYTPPSGYTLMTRASASDSPTYDGNRMHVARLFTDAATLSGRTCTHSGTTHDAATIHVVFDPA